MRLILQTWRYVIHNAYIYIYMKYTIRPISCDHIRHFVGVLRGTWCIAYCTDGILLHESLIKNVSTYRDNIGRDKMAASSRRYFQIHFVEWKFMNFGKFDPKGPINNIPALVQMMAWCRSGDKPLSEPTLVNLLAVGATRVTRPQWCKEFYISYLRVCSTSYRTNHTFSIKTGKATLGSMTCRNSHAAYHIRYHLQ